MKLVFLCGSLEFGKDGVGDYTRQLGLELINQGHQVIIIALNDKASVENPDHSVSGFSKDLKEIRYSSALSWENRKDKLDRILNICSPDWISLQYVPYSFHSKGIPYEFVKCLIAIKKSRCLHIMFHETWLGISSLSPLKHKIMGFFQQEVAKYMIRTLTPEKIFTSNRLYQMVLMKANIEASLVPLFSNIPFRQISSTFYEKLSEQLKINPGNRNEYTILGIFGKLHPGYDFNRVITEALNNATLLNKQLIFLSFGRIGDLKEFDKLQSQFPSVKFLLLGELSEEEVSATLQVLDSGLSCTPFEHIGKSGVYAAMRLHGVNVLLPFSDPIPEYESKIKEYNTYLHSRPLNKWSVEYVASKYLKHLEN